ncbi:MAG: WD40 repeat domain-containing protein, partial [Planctomycetia bacterium]
MIEFSPDGTLAAVGRGYSHGLDVYSTADGKHVWGDRHHHWLRCIAFTPNGETLVSACAAGVVVFWDAKTGRQLVQEKGGADQIWFSEDGRRMGAKGFPGFRFMELDAVPQVPLNPWSDWGPSGYITPDGRRILSYQWEDRRAKVMDVETKKISCEYVLPNHFTDRPALTSDGRSAYYGDYNGVYRRFDLETGRLDPLGSDEPTYTLRTFAFHPDGRTLVCIPYWGERIDLIDAVDGKTSSLLSQDLELRNLTFFDADRLAVGDKQGTIRIVSIAENRVVEEKKLPGGSIEALAFDAVHETIVAAVADNRIWVWSPDSGVEPRSLGISPARVGALAMIDAGA